MSPHLDSDRVRAIAKGGVFQVGEVAKLAQLALDLSAKPNEAEGVKVKALEAEIAYLRRDRIIEAEKHIERLRHMAHPSSCSVRVKEDCSCGLAAEIADAEAHLRGISPTDDPPLPLPEHGWTCFHCGETFHTVAGARRHFGLGPEQIPECKSALVSPPESEPVAADDRPRISILLDWAKIVTEERYTAEYWSVIANLREKVAAFIAPPSQEASEAEGLHGLDTAERVRFYEHDFYPLSNFSAFSLRWHGHTFPTSEHAYHWSRFALGWDLTDAAGHDAAPIAAQVMRAPSAHEAFKIAQANKHLQHPNWAIDKIGVMRGILRAKADQHEYVRRKLLATGDRELVEDSWRDDFWGWGPNRDGQNMLGKLWMELRAALNAAKTARKM